MPNTTALIPASHQAKRAGTLFTATVMRACEAGSLKRVSFALAPGPIAAAWSHPSGVDGSSGR